MSEIDLEIGDINGPEGWVPIPDTKRPKAGVKVSLEDACGSKPGPSALTDDQGRVLLKIPEDYDPLIDCVDFWVYPGGAGPIVESVVWGEKYNLPLEILIENKV